LKIMVENTKSLLKNMNKFNQTGEIMKQLKIIIMIFLFTSCSTIRMKHESEANLKDGRTAKFEFEKSYKVPSKDKTLCWITGILYGGWCWMYLGMPGDKQREEIKSDAHKKLKGLLKEKEFTIVNNKTSRASWNKGEVNAHLTFLEGFKNTKSSNSPIKQTKKGNVTIRSYKNLKRPLSITAYNLKRVDKDNVDRYQDLVYLTLRIQNRGSKRVTAWSLTVNLSTKLV
jgi:hypothetical protein